MAMYDPNQSYGPRPGPYRRSAVPVVIGAAVLTVTVGLGTTWYVSRTPSSEPGIVPINTDPTLAAASPSAAAPSSESSPTTTESTATTKKPKTTTKTNQSQLPPVGPTVPTNKQLLRDAPYALPDPLKLVDDPLEVGEGAYPTERRDVHVVYSWGTNPDGETTIRMSPLSYDHDEGKTWGDVAHGKNGKPAHIAHMQCDGKNLIDATAKPDLQINPRVLDRNSTFCKKYGAFFPRDTGNEIADAVGIRAIFPELFAKA